MGYVDAVVTRIGVFEGALYSQVASRFIEGGVEYRKTERYMTRPDGRYFNVMKDYEAPNILYEDLPASIKAKARKPNFAKAIDKAPLSKEEVDYYTGLHSEIETGEWVKVEENGVDTYMPKEQYAGGVKTGAFGGILMIGVIIIALWYFLLGNIRRD